MLESTYKVVIEYNTFCADFNSNFYDNIAYAKRLFESSRIILEKFIKSVVAICS